MIFCFFKQRTAYEICSSEWSSDVCSSDLAAVRARPPEELPGDLELRGSLLCSAAQRGEGSRGGRRR